MKKYVYRVICHSIFGRMQTEQMERFKDAMTYKKFFDLLPFIKKCEIRKQKPDMMQKWERKWFKGLTHILEHFNPSLG